MCHFVSMMNLTWRREQSGAPRRLGCVFSDRPGRLFAPASAHHAQNVTTDRRWVQQLGCVFSDRPGNRKWTTFIVRSVPGK